MNPGDVVWIDFPGVVQTKRRPAVVLSSATYHAARPDVIVGLITSQTSKATSPTDFPIHDWQAAGLRVPSAFRAFIVTLPGRCSRPASSPRGGMSTSQPTAVRLNSNTGSPAYR